MNNSDIKWHSRIIILIALLTVFTISCIHRQPDVSQGFKASDATYHTLLTMECYEQTPASVHRFLPIQTYGADYNKFINNGPSLLQDDLGNNYYISFSSLGFLAPYLFCKLFRLEISIHSLFIFNSLLMMLSAALLGLLIYRLFKKEAYSYIAAASYIFIPEVMISQGIVYWHHSLSQVLLLAQMLLFVMLVVENVRSKALWILLGVVSFLFPYLEWSGFVSNAAIVFGISYFAFLKLKQADVSEKRTIFKQAFAKVCTISAITVLSLGYLLFRYSYIGSLSEIISTFLGRFDVRNSSSIVKLLEGYRTSLLPLLLITAIAGCILALMLVFKKISIDPDSKLIGCLIVFSIPTIENLIMRQHAIIYTFDRLKLILPLMLLFIYFLDELKVLFKHLNIFVLVSLSLSELLTLNYYGKNIIFPLYEYQNSNLMHQYVKENYINDEKAVLAVGGLRAWGYLQTQYDRNIYFFDFYPPSELYSIAQAQNKNYILVLQRTSWFADTSCYTKAALVDLSAKKIFKLDSSGGVVEVQLLEYDISNSFHHKKSFDFIF